MTSLFLLPSIISLFLVIRGRIETAFLAVYLPALLLLPNGYACRLPHLPPISAAQAALIPIGAVALYRLIRTGRPVPMDCLVSLFIVSLTLSEILREPVRNDGIQVSLSYFVSIFLAYATGRKLIEPGLRLATVRTMVILILLLGPLGLIEWRLAQNYYGIIGQRIFQTWDVPAAVQLRSGHGRMGAAFTDAEICGIAIGMILALNAWLVYLNKLRPGVYLGKLFAKLERHHLLGLLLLLLVLLTQSRGPLLSLAVAYLILQIPKFRSTKIATVIVAILILAGLFAGYHYFSQYTNVNEDTIVSEQQSSAVYRRQMNELYQPIVEQGGWFGWGLLHHPSIAGLKSIDNEFLLVRLAQGRFGYLLFVLIALESVRRLTMFSWRFPSAEERAFAFSMLAAMAAFWLSLLTVYMGEQLPQVGFLLIGWSQSIKPGAVHRVSEPAPELVPAPKFAFQRIFR
jgi:hypothetical protein